MHRNSPSAMSSVTFESVGYNMISNENEQKRFSSLDIRIKEAAI